MGLPETTRNVYILAIFISCFLTGAFSQDGACSQTRRTNNLAECLSKIRQIALDPSKFWFGSDYAAKCPSYLKDTINCYNPYQDVKSLADLSFGDNTDLSSLDRYVDVKYSSLPGKYVGCDYAFEQKKATEFFVDPLSNTAYTPWDLRALPEVTWTANQADFFTLVVVDVGYRQLRGLYVNIPGNVLSRGETIQAYQGPQNTREVPNPYAFILYKQASSIKKSDIVIPEDTPFNAAQAAQTYNFGELVGLSWVLASFDAYALEQQAPLGIIQNCADLVSKAFKSHPHRPFLPDPLDLSVYLRLHFNQDATTYPCGDEDKALPSVDFFVDPIGNPIISTADVRTETTKTFSMQMNKRFPNNKVDFQGKMYTLMNLDPDIPSIISFVGSNESPLLHGLIINIYADDVTSGNPVKPIIGPEPPDPYPHFYYFVLYEQKGPIMLTNTSAFTDQGRCNTDFPDLLFDRCLFNVTAFVSKYDLKLVGATWLAATKDDYVECVKKPQSDASKGSGVAASILLYLLTAALWVWFLNPI